MIRRGKPCCRVFCRGQSCRGQSCRGLAVQTAVPLLAVLEVVTGRVVPHREPSLLRLRRRLSPFLTCINSKKQLSSDASFRSPDPTHHLRRRLATLPGNQFQQSSGLASINVTLNFVRGTEGVDDYICPLQFSLKCAPGEYPNSIDSSGAGTHRHCQLWIHESRL
jgi:hypothetical protein